MREQRPRLSWMDSWTECNLMTSMGLFLSPSSLTSCEVGRIARADKMTRLTVFARCSSLVQDREVRVR